MASLPASFKYQPGLSVADGDMVWCCYSELMPKILAGYAQRLTDDPGARPSAGSAIGRKDNALVIEAGRALGIDLSLARYVASLE